ncbi:MAG TPA: xanthine dehydrogenase family protein molybdopterin-binding subunit [Acidimicrobiales bacterium]|nr:xanthine dehydrogenase family protein molybdopterin-binding subunit [Acidimicrobiales bacterium]
MGSILGNRVARLEDPRFLTVGGTYVEDVVLPDAAWLTYVRSSVAHARITGIDVSGAKTAPGVLAVLTGDDLAELGLAPASASAFADGMRRPFVARGVVRFVGEAVVAIVAEDRAHGSDAADLVEVDYEPLPVVIDPEAALRDEQLLFPDVGTNIVQRFTSGSRADFAGCEVVVEERIVNQRLTAAPIEPRSAAAYWTDDGRLVHYAACQGAHPTRDLLATVYGLDPSQVQVVVPDVGGGFGAKSRTFPDEAALGFYALAAGRPVRWTESRSENMAAMAHGRGQIQHARLGGTRDGRITAYQLDVVQDAGAYPVLGARLPAMTMLMTTGAYDIADAGFSGVSVVTNTMSTTAYRGAGRPEAAVAIERMVDRFAAEIEMDPADVRRRNLVAPFRDRYTTGVGTVYDVGDYPEALERVLRAADYDALRAERARRRDAGDPVALGIGIAAYVEITAGVRGDREFGAVELLDAGRMRVRSGSTPTGQGHDTTWAMIVADRTGVALDDVEVIHGDTDRVLRGGLTVSSRSVQLGGAAIAEACDTLVERARGAAAELLEASVDDVVLDREAGRFHVTGAPARSLGWADLVAADGAALSADADHVPAMPTFPFGAHVAVVEVDTETGRVDLRRIVALDDAGRILNPLVAEGQVHGGIAQGAAQALLEAIHYDEEGQPLTTNFADYPVISATELPSFELVHMATPTFVNELGAKGIGESGTIGAIPAVYNAVIDAVGHLGVRHLETPLTPERVWAALAVR